MIIETHATLRVFSESLSRDRISEVLGVNATGGHEKDPSAKSRSKRESSYWCWTTKGALETADNSAHIDQIINKFQDKEHALRELREQGCETDICSFLVTTGQGGPELELSTMASLNKLGLPIWWDIYFDENET